MIGFLKACVPAKTLVPGPPPWKTFASVLFDFLTSSRFSDTRHQRPRWAGTSQRSANSLSRLL